MQSEGPRFPLSHTGPDPVLVDALMPRLLAQLAHQAACLRAARSPRLTDGFAAGYVNGAVAQTLGETLLALEGVYRAVFEQTMQTVFTRHERLRLSFSARRGLHGEDPRYDAGLDAGIADACEGRTGAVTSRWLRDGTEG